jgi:hypothetical protein
MSTTWIKDSQTVQTEVEVGNSTKRVTNVMNMWNGDRSIHDIAVELGIPEDDVHTIVNLPPELRREFAYAAMLNYI